MAKANVFKSNFTAGVLDPRLLGRADLSQYANGLERGDNVVILPYGGFRRRGGLKYLTEIPAAVAGDCQLAAFSYNSTSQQYLLVFADQRIYFLKDDALITNINGGGLDYLASPWPVSVVRELKWAQTADTMIVVHEDYAPRKLVRGATDATWTLSTLSFDAVPQIDYNDGSSPAASSEQQDVTFTGFNVGNTFKLDVENVTTENITYDTNATTIQNRIVKALQKLWNVGDGDITCVFTAGTTYRITFQNGAARNYDLMTGFATSGSGTIAVAAVANGSPRTEDAWSAARGWPRSVCFYEARLVFGGTKSKPSTLFMSKSNGLFDFDLGEGLDDDGIQRTLLTDQVNAIVNVVPGRHLQVFTEGAEFFVPDFPITPENSNFRPQTSYGNAIPAPIEVEGATLFLDVNARGLYQFLYSDVEAAYSADSLSRISSALLATPVDCDRQRPSSDEDTNLCYFVNSDGTVAVLNTLRSEQIAAWTRFTTQGSFISAAALTDQMYFLVQRTDSAAADHWYVEKLDSAYYLDCAEQSTGASSATWAVGSRLNGLECWARGNSVSLGTVTPAAGSVTVITPVTSIEVGLWFEPAADLMPPAIDTGAGLALMRKSRFANLHLLVVDTAAVAVNGQTLPDRYMDLDPLDTAPELATGVYDFTDKGWGTMQRVQIRQVAPMPMTILAAEYEMEMN